MRAPKTHSKVGGPVPLPAGDDTIDITGHIYSFAQALPATRTIIVGNISPVSSEVLAGDTIVVYSYPSLQVRAALDL